MKNPKIMNSYLGHFNKRNEKATNRVALIY